MVPEDSYLRNLALAEKVRNVEGCAAECGAWRRGMIPGIADRRPAVVDIVSSIVSKGRPILPAL
jgi:hypothetical protein